MTEQNGSRSDQCDACRYWRNLLGQSQLGQCRIAPPVPSSGGSAAWPEVGADDWCGQFQSRDTVATTLMGSISHGLDELATGFVEARQSARKERARPVAEDTQMLLQLLDIYIEGWNTSSDQFRQQILHELRELAEDFILENGAWKSDKAVRQFLFKTRSPVPPANRQGAINYLQLMEAGHAILGQTKALPKCVTSAPMEQIELIA